MQINLKKKNRALCEESAKLGTNEAHNVVNKFG